MIYNLNAHLLAYILRHHPEKFNIKLDEFGWCQVDDLLKIFRINLASLDNIVNNNTRFIYNTDKSKIKAAHGHSIKVKYTQEAIPPKILYHGTSLNLKNKIKTEGIKHMTRAQVHLSESKADAIKIAKRHSDTIWVIKINTEAMIKDGYKFYKSEDGVWLTSDIKPKYFKNS